MAESSMFDVQVGGGIRSSDDVQRWLEAGVARCVVGSVAMEDPQIVANWLRQFGQDKIVLALDIRLDESGIPRLTSHGWTQNLEVTLWDLLNQFSPTQQVLCTDVSRDGALCGPSLDLYQEILHRFPDLQLQASGGIRNVEDLEALRRIGCPAAISGRALLDGKISASEVRSFRQSA